ncbi:MAG: sulfide/dihydroorotate dehydrogenase-like FAD/NAD-binding protein [Elusimicrobiota bacterium]
MNEITLSETIGKDICYMVIKNKAVASSFKPGQFVVLRVCEKGERIPLTIVDSFEGKISVIVQNVGYSTAKLCSLKKGDVICDLAGPLGKPSEIKNYGHAVMVAGGIGAAPLLPVARALKKAGNRMTVIQGARSKEHIILQEELKEVADRYVIVSDDGSVGEKDFVTGPFKRMASAENKPDFVFAVGPAPMMKAVAMITRPAKIPLKVSLNPVMVDGTGMCGSCRVEVGGETKFACVDGPEFDGNEVDYDLLQSRLKMYCNMEKFICEECKNNG